MYPGDAAQGTQAALQKGERLLAAGYALYSSTTMLVLSLGSGVFGFTLDPALGEFLLTHPNMQMPPRGELGISACEEPGLLQLCPCAV